MKRLLPLLIPFLLSAQVTVTLTGPGTVSAGGTATLTVSCTGCSASNVPAVQWTMGLPAGFTLGTPAVTSSDPSGSIAACGPLACLVAGSPIKLTDGTIETIPVSIALNAKLGAASIPLSGLFAADINALNVAAVSGAAYSFTVNPSTCDVNSDGIINVADVLVVIAGDIGTGTCPISAANGSCTIVAVQQVVNAIATGVCKVP